MTQIAKSEPLAILDLYSGSLCCRSQVIGDEYGRAERFPSFLRLSLTEIQSRFLSRAASGVATREASAQRGARISDERRALGSFAPGLGTPAKGGGFLGLPCPLTKDDAIAVSVDFPVFEDDDSCTLHFLLTLYM